MDVSGDIRSCDIEEMEEFQPEIFCYICRYVNDWSASCSIGSPLMKLKAAGTLKLITTSKDRMDDDFHGIISNIPVISVHKECYKFYTHPFYANVAKKRKLSEKNGEEGSAKNIRIEEDSNNSVVMN